MTKTEASKARAAGAALFNANNSTLPAEAREDPIGACPFAVGDPQRAEWLKGFRDALKTQQTAVTEDDLAKAIDDA